MVMYIDGKVVKLSAKTAKLARQVINKECQPLPPSKKATDRSDPQDR